MNNILLANFLGFASLVCYGLTLVPTNLRVIFPKTKSAGIPKNLLKHRRLIGVMAFYLALCHGILLISKRNFDMFDAKTYGVYVQGVFIFLVFACLTMTSNDWSIKLLKKNWKKVHQLTYLCMFLLIWHIWDKMSGHWSLFTPLALILAISITVLFVLRRWTEIRNRKPQKPQQSRTQQPQLSESKALAVSEKAQ